MLNQLTSHLWWYNRADEPLKALGQMLQRYGLSLLWLLWWCASLDDHLKLFPQSRHWNGCSGFWATVVTGGVDDVIVSPTVSDSLPSSSPFPPSSSPSTTEGSREGKGERAEGVWEVKSSVWTTRVATVLAITAGDKKLDCSEGSQSSCGFVPIMEAMA